jgi:hypothetical protein
MRKRPPLTVDEAASQLFFGSGEDRKQLATWAAKEEVCSTAPTACRLRMDTVGPNVVRCRESTDDQRGLSTGSYVGACRIAGTDVMALYPCRGTLCEELHAIAVAGLGSYRPISDSTARR